ncbi:MAG: bifunctional folylpolyglutamate synthase/dihydrofolate synthase [Eggerthellaceae bacterium]|nr:bifunctional folylpolyglutamate synthase/dihydrofolate synthase [Eggerthellaceae bacterium]
MDFDPVAYINNPAWHSSIYGLERIEELLRRLGDPHKQLKFVHVAGTNGKGSVCAYLDSVLRAAGYKTGLFTSPYIETFEERIRVDGQNIPMDALREITLEVRDIAEAMAQEDPSNHPTEFELMCAVAMVHFARSGCDIVVLEVGLGGRWDATNVIDAPECCVIVRIGLDHTDLLGTTTAEIAAEKAGIIKAGTNVVSWPQDEDALASIRAVCMAQEVPLAVADLDALRQSPVTIDVQVQTEELPRRAFSYKGKQYKTQLLASYQPSNATLALEAIEVLRGRGWVISEEAVQQGIASAMWPGRFEVVQRNPLVIIDGGHNPQGAAVLAETLADVLPTTKPVFIVGILADKDYCGMLEAVADLGESFVCVTPPNPRALSAKELCHALCALRPEVSVHVAEDFDSAVDQAFELAGADGVVCAFGSLYSIHDLKQALARWGKAHN